MHTQLPGCTSAWKPAAAQCTKTKLQATPSFPAWCSGGHGRPSLALRQVVRDQVPSYGCERSSPRTWMQADTLPPPAAQTAQKPHWTVVSFTQIFYKNTVQFYRSPATGSVPQPAAGHPERKERVRRASPASQHRPAQSRFPRKQVPEGEPYTKRGTEHSLQQRSLRFQVLKVPPVGDRTVFLLPRQACFTQHHVLKVHLRCTVCQNGPPIKG